MFLSRVEVPWDFARNSYNLHRQLWRLFPGEPSETRRHGGESRQGFLFRIEENQPGRVARLLVQSARPPETTSGVTLVGAREFNPAPQAGQRLAFVLTVNPIKTIADTEIGAKPDKKSAKCRVPLIREEEQRTWLERKLSGAAVIEAAVAQPHPPLYFRKGNRAGKFVTVTFEGVIRVQEPALVISLLKNGIGPAKAFGCGLMLLRRV